MAKWCGVIGFAGTMETEPGYYEEVIKERQYYGDEVRNTRRLQNTEGSTNRSVTISNSISVVADPYAMDNIYDMRYATFRGAKWTVDSVDVQYPRLILSLGGLYNG